MYTREQLADRFNPHPDTNPEYCPRLTDAQLDTLEAIQAAGAEHGKAGYYPDGDFSSDADWCYGIGDLINRLEMELDIDDGSVFDLYQEAHSEHFQDGTINPEDRNSYSRDSIFDFQFGAYGDTKCSVHASSLENALELAADWLADNAPGHLIRHDDREFWQSELANSAKELGYPADQSEWTEEQQAEIEERATTDLTYTEAGYLRSWEWFVNEG